MNRILAVILTLCSLGAPVFGVDPPSGIIARAGDQSIILHWDRNSDTAISGYRVYRATSPGGSFTLQTATLLNYPGFADLNAINGRTNYYRLTAVTSQGDESAASETIAAASRPFPNDDGFLEYIQQAHFDYFWYGANATNGLVPDRLPSGGPCSIAAVGFGLTAIGIAVDHGWISRTQGLARVLTTLRTFADGPQGSASAGVIGYKGWFYHFLDMNTAVRYAPFGPELSSIDTALLLGGVLYAKQFFDKTNAEEVLVRELADTIYSRVDWDWMARGGDALSMGWQPTGGFLTSNWIGYNEAMLLYILGLGASSNSLPSSSWSRWTSGYNWATYYGQSFVPFPPLFGHQYSHCWIDFRYIADYYMRLKNSTYFENSRRATIAQRAYCIANPLGRVGYSSNVWGLTACDGPNGYSARGAPPAQNDDGTIAPTAAGGSVAFAPEYCVPALKQFYTFFRRSIWTAFGFRDAFNQGAQWWGPDEIGIDQGPIVIMIENYRTQSVWKRFMKNPEVQRGLQRAGFVPLSFVPLTPQPSPAWDALTLGWSGLAGQSYQVEYSPDLERWFAAPDGRVVAPGSAASWTDTGPPGTSAEPFSDSSRFYRVFQFP